MSDHWDELERDLGCPGLADALRRIDQAEPGEQAEAAVREAHDRFPDVMHEISRQAPTLAEYEAGVLHRLDPDNRQGEEPDA